MNPSRRLSRPVVTCVRFGHLVADGPRCVICGQRVPVTVVAS